MAQAWREVGDRVFVRRHVSYDLNVGLVVGDGACLVIDTRASHREARDLAEAVRQVTASPWSVVNTHAHFDHYFGNSVFLPAVIWGHERCAQTVTSHGELHREQAIADARSRGYQELAAELSEVDIRPPTEVLATTATLDVGDRRVELRHLGRGHTDNDVVVSVPDAGVLFAGDLVEEGAPPAFEDSYPLDWPSTVDRLLDLVHGPVVPGHGDVVDRAFVAGQRDQLVALADLARRAHADGRPVDDACHEAPFPPDTARHALIRAYATLPQW